MIIGAIGLFLPLVRGVAAHFAAVLTVAVAWQRSFSRNRYADVAATANTYHD